jgi:hypothetical protein
MASCSDAVASSFESDVPVSIAIKPASKSLSVKTTHVKPIAEKTGDDAEDGIVIGCVPGPLVPRRRHVVGDVEAGFVDLADHLVPRWKAQSCGINCAQIASIPTNSVIDTAAAASSRKVFMRVDPPMPARPDKSLFSRSFPLVPWLWLTIS